MTASSPVCRFPALLVFALLTLFSSTASATPAKTLAAATECPQRGPYVGCLMSADILPAIDFSDIYGTDNSPPNTKVYAMRGRLNGGAAQPYRLKISKRPEDAAWTDGGSDLPDVAYLGQSASNR